MQQNSAQPVKTLLVGAGYWGKNLARVLHEKGCLAAICDPDHAGMAGKLAGEYQVPLFATLSESLAALDIKAMVIASPAVTHYQLVKQALEAGLDVFVEKPLALKEENAKELSQLADDKGRILMVGHLLQYHPVYLKLKEVLQKGDLGKLRYIYSNRLNMGKLRSEENVLWSFAPHDISMILDLVGEEPCDVSCQGHSFVSEDVADITLTHLQFTSGVRSHIFVSWLHPFKEQKLVVVCEEGMLVFNDTLSWDEKLQLYRHKVNWDNGVPVAEKGTGELIPVTQDEPLGLELSHFHHCVTTRTTPRTDGWEGTRVLSVLNRAQKEIARPAPAPTSNSEYFAHETAAVDANVQIGAGSKIWHFSHVLSGTTIGKDCIIGQNAMLGPDVTIGDGCKVQNNVSLYNKVTLEKHVFCGPSCVFTNVMTPRAHINRKDEFSPTLVKEGATIGANATIICGNTIGRYAMIGAGAVVTKSVPDHALVVGNPAKQMGWVSESGERMGEDLICPRTGLAYEETAGGLRRKPMMDAEGLTE
ncbi:Gfo/Idh/MocA family oxidoreductase [Magnetococcus sp. PR-3]|uniref:Gfo/Idh/MocA family oxidoreductase n=1 Tax=Magnetococcus sp. PR-3 TaxID=3120355 RepID=UPI002FCE1C2D